MDQLDKLRTDAPKWIFKAWMEDWENVAVRQRNDSVAEAKLLMKYKHLKFTDLDNNNTILTILGTNMECIWRGGWHVIAAPLKYFEVDDEDLQDDHLLEPWPTSNDLIELIEETEQAPELNITIVHNEKVSKTKTG